VAGRHRRLRNAADRDKAVITPILSTLWQTRTDEPRLGGILATVGDLAFTGEGSGDLSAFARSGDNTPPMSYEIDGEQFIAVAADGRQIWASAEAARSSFSDWRTPSARELHHRLRVRCEFCP